MGKVLLVTGAGRGIGAATALRAARDGWAVAVNYQRDEGAANAVVEAVRAQGGQALPVQADVAAPDQIARLFAVVERELGPLGGLVNNAGITGGLGKFMDCDPAALASVFDINVLGLMQCSRHAVDAFRRAGQGGVIVNVSSTAATSGSPNDYIGYAASKAAVDTFTMGLGKELAPEGIRVCGVAPGFTNTTIHAAGGQPDRLQRKLPGMPMGRPAEPEEIAEAIAWLLSPAASYMTGTTIRCAGGS
ncbi:SDR family oxidoreductase [Pseudoduganella sp. RAF53_2]|uniref:SDR family oxidoreductase n=1 Tax=unclassified Pseudoduganella TaxID=2637179 RepID=UPI003F9AC6A2